MLRAKAERQTGDELALLRDVGKIFRVDPKTVSRWVTKNRLPALRTPGGHYRVWRFDVETLLAGGTPEHEDG
jgi:excisionase family DNA binding protein